MVDSFFFLNINKIISQWLITGDRAGKETKRPENLIGFANKIVPLEPQHLAGCSLFFLPPSRLPCLSRSLSLSRPTCNELIRVQPRSGLLGETVFSQAEPSAHCRALQHLMTFCSVDNLGLGDFVREREREKKGNESGGDVDGERQKKASEGRQPSVPVGADPDHGSADPVLRGSSFASKSMFCARRVFRGETREDSASNGRAS